MTSKLDNKAGAKQVISGCEFFMAVPLSDQARWGGKQEHFAWGLNFP